MTQTAGCIAATAGLCVTSFTLHLASVLTGPADAATKIVKHSRKQLILPISALIAGGSAAAFAQAAKAPSNKALWLASGGLVGSILPYNYFLTSSHVKNIEQAADEGKAAEPADLAALLRHTWLRAALLGAGTVIAIVALSHKAK